MAGLKREVFGVPQQFSFLNGTPASFTLDESTDQIEYIFQAPEAATITRLGFRYGVRTGTPPVFKISLQGVDGSGRADGTIKGGASPASATFTPPADTSWNSTWQWITLDNAFAVARGDFLSIVIIYSSGTISGANSSSFSTTMGLFRDDGGLPYSVTFNATGSATARNAALALFGFGSSTTAYGTPLTGTTIVTINSGTTPDEVALSFVVPAGLANTVQCVGARLWITSTVTAGTTHKLILYDGTTVLQDVTWDSDLVVATTRAHMDLYFDETTLSTLLVGNTYRLAIQPQAATSIAVGTIDFAANADIDAWPGGKNWVYSSRVDAGAWTDLTTRRLLIAPILADISGGGSHLI